MEKYHFHNLVYDRYNEQVKILLIDIYYVRMIQYDVGAPGYKLVYKPD